VEDFAAQGLARLAVVAYKVCRLPNPDTYSLAKRANQAGLGTGGC